MYMYKIDSYLIRGVAISVGGVAKTPDFPKEYAIAPHVTGSGVLPVVQGL